MPKSYVKQNNNKSMKFNRKPIRKSKLLMILIVLMSLIACSTSPPLLLHVSLPPRPPKPKIQAIDKGDYVELTKDDFTQLTQYLIKNDAYIDSLELTLKEYGYEFSSR